MELSENELIEFLPELQLKRISILKKVLGIEDFDLDVSEAELHNVIDYMF